MFFDVTLSVCRDQQGCDCVELKGASKFSAFDVAFSIAFFGASTGLENVNSVIKSVSTYALMALHGRKFDVDLAELNAPFTHHS